MNLLYVPYFYCRWTSSWPQLCLWTALSLSSGPCAMNSWCVLKGRKQRLQPYGPYRLCSAAWLWPSASIQSRSINFTFSRCRPLILTPCLSGTSALVLYGTVATAVVVPLCSLTILGCFCLLCWDMRAGPLCTKRGCVTLTLQVAQVVLFSVPMVMNSYLIPGYLHSDVLDIAATIIYNLGVSLIPLVYGYRSRELQQRIRQAALWSKVHNLNVS